LFYCRETVSVRVLTRELLQGSQASRIERDSHSFRSFVTPATHCISHAEKTIYNIFNMPPRHSHCWTGRARLPCSRLEPVTSQPIKKRKRYTKASQSENSTIVSG